MTVKSYRDLEVWRRAMDLVIACYDVTDHFPKMEMYSLGAQLNRAGVSVPANVAEGWGRDSTKEYIHHLSIAHGSLMELETHLTIAQRRKYITVGQEQGLLTESGILGRQLNALKRALERKVN